jgi:hypothetical protein
VAIGRVFELHLGGVDFAEAKGNALIGLPDNMHPLAQIIDSLQRRLVWRRRAVAACWVAATAIGAALVLGLADYLTRSNDRGLRIMATAAFAAAIAWAAYRWWYLPQRKKLRPLVVARRLESQFPQLGDSLASAVEFLGQAEDEETAGSAQLRRLVIADAHNKIEALPIEEAIDPQPLRRALRALAIATLALIICLMIDATSLRIATARLAAPLSNLPWPRQHHLEFRKIPKQLAQGQTFEIELVDTAGALPEDVKIEFEVARNGRREVSSEPMLRVGDTMVARRENVSQSFAFRAQGGDDDTMPWYAVEVKELPRLASLKIMAHPPAYTGLPVASAERHLEVLVGTGIEMSGSTTEPIRSGRILLENGAAIEAAVGNDDAGKERQRFQIDPKKWIAKQTGQYKIELVNDSGLAGIVAQGNLRVDPDSAPSVSWVRPADDMYVLPRAVLPIELLLKDNLLIERVELTYDRNDKSENERIARPKEPPIVVYQGPEKPTPRENKANASPGESRVVSYSWDLAPLRLPAGAVLSIEGQATDYRPGTGKTVGPRRISIINADELETRLADRQLQIARQLERALTTQRQTREDVRQVAIQLQDAGSLTSRDRGKLQTSDANQRSVTRMLVDPAEGVMPLIDAISNEIEINLVENSEMQATMNRLIRELKQLAAGPLSTATQELTSARKVGESVTANGDSADNSALPFDASQAKLLANSLATAAAKQDDSITALERLVAELSGKTDLRRVIRLLTELREDQLSHEKTTRTEIGVQTLPLDVGDLSRAQRANLNKAAAGQAALAARFAKIEPSLDQLAHQLTGERDPTAGRVADAIDLSRSLNIAMSMQQAAADVRENRVSRALELEKKIAADLAQVLKLLRNEGERQTEQLVDKLKEAEQKLAALRHELSNLRQQIAQNERTPNAADADQMRQFAKEQQALKRNIEQLARELDRLQAADAGKSAQDAANQLENRSSKQNNQNQNAARPSSSNQVQKAEQNLERAAQQLAARQQQLEDDLATEFVRRFQNELTQMVERQQRVIKRTVELDTARKPAALSAEQSKTLGDLATDERQLAEQAKEHSELLFGLGAVRVSLEDAERRLAAAEKLLVGGQSGTATQRAEQLALTRLEAMMQAFSQTANEADKKPDANNPPPPPGAGKNEEQPQRRPTFELLEVKMLRILQADLNERTRDHERRAAGADGKPDPKATLDEEARELSAEQGRLAELVQKMLTRDNEKQE